MSALRRFGWAALLLMMGCGTTEAPKAFEGGADHIVVGRPIRDADDPRAAAQGIQREIAAVFE